MSWKLNFGCLEKGAIHSTEPPPITGGIGLGGWGTSVEFKDLKVEGDGQTLYAADFTKSADGWRTDGGRWSVQDGAYRQEITEIGLSWFGETESWTNYTLTLKARKLAGRKASSLWLVARTARGSGGTSAAGATASTRLN